MKEILYSMLVVSILVCLPACDEDETLSSENLFDYIENSRLTLVKDNLIACAASGQVGFLGDQEKRTSVFFYPEGDAHTFKYFESSSEDIDPNDYAVYTERVLSDAPVFNGYLRRFQRTENEVPIWCIVTFIKNGALHISNPIKLKLPDLPTEFNTNLLDVDLNDPLSPNFSWNNGLIDENEIYFHVLSDANGNLISGTYTFERQFQFYKLDNVVLNIRDVMPAPILELNKTYTITIMGVSIDNWVNVIMEKSFNTD